jgi:transcription termination factor Rho
MGPQGKGDNWGGGPPRRRRRRRKGGPAAGEGGSPAVTARAASTLLGNGGTGSTPQPGQRPPRWRDEGRRPPQGPGGGRHQAGPRPQGVPSQQVTGVLQVTPQGNGFLRSPATDYNPEPTDAQVPRELVHKLGLEMGVEITGLAVPSPSPHRGPWVAEIQTVNGIEPEAWARRMPFKNLTAEDPTERIRLELEPGDLSTRVVDLIAPIGKGQRCLIVAPPKAGKTVLLQRIARSITANHPEIHLIVLLVDERPEEVTDMRRTVRGEVIASSSDELARNHVQVAEIALERAKRLVETGRDVVVLLDSITRLSRAYNTEQRGSGRVLSGGIDARTMEKPRRFFGAARKVSGAPGSLTVIGTALVDTGSRMDEVIFQEFKGTGNTEIVMDRGLFERRIFPAIDISKTGTRKEEKLYEAKEYSQVSLLRRALASLRPAEAMQLLVERLGRSTTNQEFLTNLQKI